MLFLQEYHVSELIDRLVIDQVLNLLSFSSNDIRAILIGKRHVFRIFQAFKQQPDIFVPF